MVGYLFKNENADFEELNLPRRNWLMIHRRKTKDIVSGAEDQDNATTRGVLLLMTSDPADISSGFK